MANHVVRLFVQVIVSFISYDINLCFIQTRVPSGPS